MLWVLAVPVPAGAAPFPCTVTLKENSPPEWERAVDGVRRLLVDDPGDCARIDVEARGTRQALLIYTTRDGRRAERNLESPEELRPTIEALLVELPVEPAATPESPPPAPSPAADAPPQIATRDPATPPSAGHLLLGGFAGYQVAGPRTVISLDVGVSATVALEGWELGVQTAFRPSYSEIVPEERNADDARPLHLSGYAAGIAVGRRAALTDVLVGRAGLTLSVGYQHAEWLPAFGGTPLEAERSQMEVGLQAGVAFPSTRRTRFLATTFGGVDPLHVANTVRYADGAPILPAWGAGLRLGVEGEVL